MAVRLVVFDLGGVMLRIRHSWSEILAEMGLRLPEGFSADRLAEHQELSRYQNGEIGEAEFLAGLSNEFGLSVDEVRHAHQLILMGDYSGARELVDEIRAGGTRAICLSNTNELHYREFFSGRFPVCEAFEELLASHQLGLSKPAPAIYEYVEDRFGVTREGIAFFDDNQGNVEAARSRGWLAELIDPEDDPPAVIRQQLVRWGVLRP